MLDEKKLNLAFQYLVESVFADSQIYALASSLLISLSSLRSLCLKNKFASSAKR